MAINSIDGEAPETINGVRITDEWKDHLSGRIDPDDLNDSQRIVLSVAHAKPDWDADDLTDYLRKTVGGDVEPLQITALIRLHLPGHPTFGRGEMTNNQRSVLRHSVKHPEKNLNEIADAVGQHRRSVEKTLAAYLPEHPLCEWRYDNEGVPADELDSFLIDDCDVGDLTDDQRRIISTAASGGAQKIVYSHIYYELGASYGGIPEKTVRETVNTYFVHPLYRTWDQLGEYEKELVDALLQGYGAGTASSRLDDLRELDRANMTKIVATAVYPGCTLDEIMEKTDVADYSSVYKRFGIDKRRAAFDYGSDERIDHTIRDEPKTAIESALTDMTSDDTDMSTDTTSDESERDSDEMPYKQKDIADDDDWFEVLPDDATTDDVHAQTPYYARVINVESTRAHVALNNFEENYENVRGVIYTPGLPMFNDFEDIHRDDEVIVGLYKRKIFDDGGVKLQFNLLTNYSSLGTSREIDRRDVVDELPGPEDRKITGQETDSREIPDTTPPDDDDAFSHIGDIRVQGAVDEDATPEESDIEETDSGDEPSESETAETGDGETADVIAEANAAATVRSIRIALDTAEQFGGENIATVADHLRSVIDDADTPADGLDNLDVATTTIRAIAESDEANKLVDTVEGVIEQSDQN